MLSVVGVWGERKKGLWCFFFNQEEQQFQNCNLSAIISDITKGTDVFKKKKKIPSLYPWAHLSCRMGGADDGVRWLRLCKLRRRRLWRGKISKVSLPQIKRRQNWWAAASWIRHEWGVLPATPPSEPSRKGYEESLKYAFALLAFDGMDKQPFTKPA